MCTSSHHSPEPSLEQILSRLQALTGQHQVAPDYVRFRIDLLKAQWSAREAATAGGASLSARAPAPARDDGKRQPPPSPLLSAQSARFDPALLASLLAAIHAATEAGHGSPEIARLISASDQEPGILEALARHAAFGPAWDELRVLARRLRISVDAALFFGRALAAPVVSAAAGRMEMPAVSRQDARGVCAVCGSPPGIALLRRDDGVRLLFCSLCGQGWEFRRLECPYCGCQQPGKLGFLRLAEADPRWVETCEECRAYVKTIDQRKLPEEWCFLPLVEDTATLHLDLLAEQEGCARRLPYVALR